MLDRRTGIISWYCCSRLCPILQNRQSSPRWHNDPKYALVEWRTRNLKAVDAAHFQEMVQNKEENEENTSHFFTATRIQSHFLHYSGLRLPTQVTYTESWNMERNLWQHGPTPNTPLSVKQEKGTPSHSILSISNRVVDSPPELVKVFAAHFFKPEPSSSVAHLLKVNIATSVLVSSAKFFHPVTQKELIFAVNSLKKSSSCWWYNRWNSPAWAERARVPPGNTKGTYLCHQ